jgi:TetR/AcrR family transcriptional regulator of autoinduction and epiphytic fitness
MSVTNQPKRRYDSSRRKQQARQTRRQILDAACQLFIERGYSGATIEAIAQAAGVATETVYASFGSKRAVLSRLVEISVGGDERPIPLLERPGPQAVRREPDQPRQIQMFASQIAEIMTRVAPIFAVMNAAAKTEPEIAELLDRLLAERLGGMTYFISTLSEHGGLRDGLDASTAAETVWALTSAEVFNLLTIERSWSNEQYAVWLTDTLTRLLLA